MKVRARLTRRLVAFVVAVAAAAPVVARAEQATADEAAIATLQKALEPGDTVTITGVDGQKSKGKLVEVGAGLLRIRQDGVDRRIAAADIQKVQRKRMGFLLGPIVGAAAGAAVLAGLATAFEEPVEPTPVLVYAGVGALIGLGIDAAINLPRTVYERERAIAVAPIVAPHALGVGVRMTF